MLELKAKCKDPEHIFYLLWGMPGQTTSSTTIHKDIIDFETNTCNGSKFYDMRQFDFHYYEKDPINRHHVVLADYIDIVYPYLAQILDFRYRRIHFDLKENVSPKLDCSFLWPKRDYKWIVSINQEIVAEHQGFECLTNLDRKYPGCKDSAYHKMFSASHENCMIINETLPNGKTICLSGDSYLIPIIPILACYFKEVVSLDNRYYRRASSVPYYEGKEFDYVVVSLSEMNRTRKYFETNFR